FEAADDLVVGEEPFLGSVGDELLELFDLRERDLDREQVGDLRVLERRCATNLTCRGRDPPPTSPSKRFSILVTRYRFVKKNRHVTFWQLRRARRRSRRGCSRGVPCGVSAGRGRGAARRTRRARDRAGATRGPRL